MAQYEVTAQTLSACAQQILVGGSMLCLVSMSTAPVHVVRVEAHVINKSIDMHPHEH